MWSLRNTGDSPIRGDYPAKPDPQPPAPKITLQPGLMAHLFEGHGEVQVDGAKLPRSQRPTKH